VDIDFSEPNENGESWVRLNGEIVEYKIRSLEISNLVSEISKNALVRKKMVSIQQSYSDISNLIMDGRDIGSVVFPNADIKFWVTASAEKRACRRWLEYKQKGKNISIQEVTKNINYRDENDQNRKVSPLIKPINSIIIDSTDMNIDETFDFALTHIQNYLKK
jgi:cytidylate kinase